MTHITAVLLVLLTECGGVPAFWMDNQADCAEALLMVQSDAVCVEHQVRPKRNPIYEVK